MPPTAVEYAELANAMHSVEMPITPVMAQR
jgi:hypothetical protein